MTDKKILYIDMLAKIKNDILAKLIDNKDENKSLSKQTDSNLSDVQQATNINGRCARDVYWTCV